MPKPIVAIVGRPNVGKSTLFNRMVGRRTAIVDNLSGLTRDRNIATVSWEDRSFYVVDTGGFQDALEGSLEDQVRAQALMALQEADVVVFLLDGRDGLSSSDMTLCAEIRRLGKPLIPVVNKVDGPRQEEQMYDFYRLGVDELLPLSALNGIGFYEVMERLAQELPVIPEGADEEEAPRPRIAVVGRPNVGKSTLVNSLLNQDRMIVSPEAGTTRDAVDTPCRYEGRDYVLIDTAGLRRKARVSESVEHYSMMRTLRGIERSDVCLILLDAREGVADQDKRIAGLVHEAGRGLVIILNKWDLTERSEDRLKTLTEQVRTELWFATYAPVLSASALTKQRIAKIYPLVDEIMAERRKRISTSDLNGALREIVAAREPPLFRRHPVRLLYITQTGTEPPAFTLFVNQPDGIDPQYLRYLERCLRDRYGFVGTPLRVYVRKRASGRDRRP